MIRMALFCRVCCSADGGSVCEWLKNVPPRLSVDPRLPWTSEPGVGGRMFEQSATTSVIEPRDRSEPRSLVDTECRALSSQSRPVMNHLVR